MSLDHMPLNQIIIIFLGVVGLLWYYICLFSVGLNPTSSGTPASAFRQFESLSITTISVSLATFVGSLLGFQQAAGEIEEIKEASPATSMVSRAVKEFTSTLSVSELQWLCAGLYILSLLIAIVFWYRGRDNTDPAISNLGKSLLGLVGGALSIALKIQS